MSRSRHLARLRRVPLLWTSLMLDAVVVAVLRPVVTASTGEPSNSAPVGVFGAMRDAT